jgi:hypothetical protein
MLKSKLKSCGAIPDCVSFRAFSLIGKCGRFKTRLAPLQGCEKIDSDDSVRRKVAGEETLDKVVAIATTEERSASDVALQPTEASLAIFSQPLHHA